MRTATRAAFGAAVDFFLEAALAGLLLVFEEEDFVDYGDAEAEGEVEEGVGDGFCDEAGVLGLALDDDTEGDDGVKAPGSATSWTRRGISKARGRRRAGWCSPGGGGRVPSGRGR